MWREPAYRERSPAVDAKDDILRELHSLGLEKDALVADIGCGTGRFLPILLEAQMEPLGIDISENCLDPDIAAHYSIIISPVTDLSDSFEVEAAVCSDMMEHIPEELIDPVLAKIAKIAKRGVVFGISSYLDEGKLHCSVHDADWWEAKLKEHWPKVVKCKMSVTHYRQNENNWGLWRAWK